MDINGQVVDRFFAILRACIALLATIACTSVHAQNVPVTSGLRIWLDAKNVNGNGTVPANGATITNWIDRSGIGNSVTSAGTSSVTYEATGLNGYPSIRMPNGAKLSGPNIFASATSPRTTIFLVHANVTPTLNFMFNLNGDTQGYDGAAARFSLHLPWGGNYYFDAGGCCGTTRLNGPYPVAFDQPILTAAGNSIDIISGFAAGTRQFIRFNGGTAVSDGDALAPPVTGGIRLGTTSGQPFDGRFSEVLVYNRALSETEVRSVECYLASKWAIQGVSGCAPVRFSVTKTNAGYPGNVFGDFNLPVSDLIYTIRVSYTSGNVIDADQLFIVDALPSNLSFFMGDFDGSYGPGTDPVGFTNFGSPISWNYNSAVRYSNAATPPTNIGQCTYTPAANYDPLVRYICIKPTGSLLSGAFELKFRAQIK